MQQIVIGMITAILISIASPSTPKNTTIKIKQHVDNPGQTPLKDGVK